MEEVVIVSACRTPVGKVPGQISSISDVNLMSLCLKEAVNRAVIEEACVQEVIVGCSFPKENYNLGRRSVITSKLPPEIVGTTVNKTCASSMESLELARNKIAIGDADVILAGGVESMSNSSYALNFFKKNVKALMKKETPVYQDIVNNVDENEMPYICEVLAKKYNISREEQDYYSLNSHHKAKIAKESGFFKDEIFPVYFHKDGEYIQFDEDEIINTSLTMETLTGEAPFFLLDGQITKYNSAPIGDAGAAVLLMSKSYAEKNNFNIMAKIKSFASVGLNNEYLGLGALEAAKANLRKANLSIDEIDLFECNEAFAVQSIINQRGLNVGEDKYNIRGGGIALGYPVGCAGLRICITLIHALMKEKKKIGLASICAGGGMGHSVILEAY